MVRNAVENGHIFTYISLQIGDMTSVGNNQTKEVKVKVAQSCLTFCDPWNSPGKVTGVGSLSLLHGIFPTQGLNPGLPHCRLILYQLSHKGSLRILEWVAYPFFRGSSRPRNPTRISCTAGGFFTNWAMREDYSFLKGETANKIISQKKDIIVCHQKQITL